MKAAIYARYSSDLQSDASIDDQIRVCQRKIAQENWSSAEVYADHGLSGASHLRPGYQRMIEDARTGRFHVLVAESMDRLSRDQEHIAGLFKQLKFSGIPIVTVAEGEISELHVGLKGTMSALFLKDLAQKTHRGLEGRVRKGRSAGGVSYGYDIVRGLDADGTQITGVRRINEAQAIVVRRIFEGFANGMSPRALAIALNEDDIAGPSGRAWRPSTIYGKLASGHGNSEQRTLRRPTRLEQAALRERSSIWQKTGPDQS